MQKLNVSSLQQEAKNFSLLVSKEKETKLFGVTDGKAIGTYLEHKFQKYLQGKYDYTQGNSAKGIDFPDLQVDMKVTSIRQPQSSCPYKSAKQKIYGLGYSLLILVYEKLDDLVNNTGTLNIKHTIFVEKEQTADFQITTGIKKILQNDGNKDDLLGFFQEKMLPVDDIEAESIADEILTGRHIPCGYLTISNALQWRLQYSRVIDKAGNTAGIVKIL